MLKEKVEIYELKPSDNHAVTARGINHIGQILMTLVLCHQWLGNECKRDSELIDGKRGNLDAKENVSDPLGRPVTLKNFSCEKHYSSDSLGTHTLKILIEHKKLAEHKGF